MKTLAERGIIRGLHPSTTLGGDGRLTTSSSAGCHIHNGCVDVANLGNGTYRCLLCEIDRQDFATELGPPQHKGMRMRWDAWRAGTMDYAAPYPKQNDFVQT